MAAVTTGIVLAAGTAYGAHEKGEAAKDAARAQERAANDANAVAQSQYETSRQDSMPWLQAGQDALAKQQAFLAGDWSGFENSPAYAYARDQMQQGIERGAAARGTLYSGGTNVDLANALNGIASQNSGIYWNQLAGVSGAGQQAAQGLGNLGANYANQYGNNRMAAGQAQANAALARGEQLAGYANAIGAGFGAYMGGMQPNNAALTGSGAGGGWGAFTPNTGGFADQSAAPWYAGVGNGWLTGNTGGSW